MSLAALSTALANKTTAESPGFLHPLGDFEGWPAEGRKPTPQKSMKDATAFPQLMRHPGEQRRALSRFACDHERDFALIPRQEITACFFSALASFNVRLAAKIED
jgi:hypothetical protein